MPTPTRVLVADGHPVTREGLKALLAADPGLLVCGEAADGPTAVALAAECRPDVVVLEADQPGLDGAAVTAELRAAGRPCRVLAVAACEQPGTVRRLLVAGACGYVLKRSPPAELVQAVKAVGAGGRYLDPQVAGAVAGQDASVGDRPGLSEREVQVLRAIAEGYSNKEIAARLGLSVKTVETYKSRAMEKLGVRSRVALVRHAVQSGWLADRASGPIVTGATGE